MGISWQTFYEMMSSRFVALLCVQLALVSECSHNVTQYYYANSVDCSGESTTHEIRGDKVCFPLKEGTSQSEDIKCDADNAAMHVTMYNGEGCDSDNYVNAFSVESGKCFPAADVKGSFKWVCHDVTKPDANVLV